jgi:UDP-N-acetylmuramoyl-tripeptide--D-alanyl-D-alanine ligase
MTFGAGEGCLIRIESVRETPSGLRIRLLGTELMVPIRGTRLAWNVAAASAVAVAFGMSLPHIASVLLDFRPPEGRLRREKLGPLTILDDAYNANPSSMRAALETLRSQTGRSRRVLVIGDMLELGKASLKAHTEIGRFAALSGPDLAVAVGRHISATIGAMIARGFPAARIHHFEDSDAAAMRVPDLLREGDVVLLKASRGLRFEKIRSAIADRFLEKTPALV